MSAQRISERYARSLFGVAEEQQILPAVYADMQLIEELCGQSRPLRRFLESPILREHKKISVLRALLAKHLHKISMQFIELLTRKGRAPYLQALAAAFIARYQAHEGLIPAQLRVAQPISEDIKQQFTSYITKITQKKPLLKTQLRPELLGGFVLRLGTHQIDKSVATALRHFKKTFMQPSSHPKS